MPSQNNYFHLSSGGKSNWFMVHDLQGSTIYAISYSEYLANLHGNFVLSNENISAHLCKIAQLS